MKHLLLLLFFFGTFSVHAQRIIKLKPLYANTQVAVTFNGYHLYFAIKHINKTLALLDDMNKEIYGNTSHLDTGKHYMTDLHSGVRNEYINDLQPLMQNGVGVFLILNSRVAIEDSRHHKVETIDADIVPPAEESDYIFVTFYEHGTKNIIFDGKMPAELYQQDIGLD